jgi:NADH-quinone oxidoreductase subunit L
MFRLVFLAFHGERRHEVPAASPAHAAPDTDHGPSDAASGHGHGSHLHDAPPAMAFALIVLAIGSIGAGLVGIPHVLGGGNRLEAFLEPSFEAHAQAPDNPEFQVVQRRAEPVSPAPQGEGGTAAAAGGHEGGDEGTEKVLMGVSVGVALAGIFLAMYFWLWNRPTAARVARGATPVYTLLLNKYYVDEIYNAVVVQPIKGISTFILWKGFDAALIDGTVNGVGRLVRGSSDTLRRLQTGSVRAYAASLFLGVVVILGWYLLR